MPTTCFVNKNTNNNNRIEWESSRFESIFTAGKLISSYHPTRLISNQILSDSSRSVESQTTSFDDQFISGVCLTAPFAEGRRIFKGFGNCCPCRGVLDKNEGLFDAVSDGEDAARRGGD